MTDTTRTTEPRDEPSAATTPDFGLDWLIDWAMSVDKNARDHYFHINDGQGRSCGCPHEDAED